VALDRAGNLLGALSLIVPDATTDAIGADAGRSPSDAAALSAMLSFLPRPSVDRLRQVLGLTPSGTVRLVDRLEAAGLVRRGAGADGRSTSVVLTAAGRRAARRVAEARAGVLEASLQVLSDTEREQLDGLLAKVLVGRMRGPGAVRWMCRLCDMQACGRDKGQCPVAEAARGHEVGSDRPGTGSAPAAGKASH
jgi:DNA-binding MarR family transcriptional regulator